jgi:predicted oxidoreductase (fatty acid repression mutant protein)
MADNKTESEKAMRRTAELGDTVLVAFFRDQDTLMKVISQLPYVELDLPHLTERAGTACQAISNIRLKDGTMGFSLVTGGDLTNEEAQIAVDLLNEYGEEQIFLFGGEGSPDQPTAVIQEQRKLLESTGESAKPKGKRGCFIAACGILILAIALIATAAVVFSLIGGG